MRLSELSERSGVSTATIKYYLREGLVPPGRQINATTAEYDEEHLRLLRLVRAMIQVGKLPVATVREILGHVDDDSLGRTMRLGAALWALPQVPEPDAEDEYVRAARQEADELLRTLGWSNARLLTSLSPAYRSLVVAVAAMQPARLRLERRTPRVLRPVDAPGGRAGSGLRGEPGVGG